MANDTFIPHVKARRGRPAGPEEVYRSRMDAVLDHISSHLADPLELDTLARIAHFSPWHFHRLFRSLQGETVADCVRRLRLEAAARMLLSRRGESVLNIALEVGMASQASFSRAFGMHFGMTASAWRRGGSDQWASRSARPLRHLEDEDAKNAESRIEVVVLPAMRLAYLRCTGAYGQTAIGATWERLAKTPGLPAPALPLVGIAQDRPEITPPAKCRYDCCVAVPAGWRRLPGLGEHSFKGGRFARVRFAGSVMEIERAWARLFSQWLPASGYETADAPAVELYEPPTRGAYRAEAFSCWLCVPIQPLRR